jgi:hypothetical protein
MIYFIILGTDNILVIIQTFVHRTARILYFVSRTTVQTVAAEKGHQSGRQSNNDCLLQAAWSLRVGPLHTLPSNLMSHTSVLGNDMDWRPKMLSKLSYLRN